MIEISELKEKVKKEFSESKGSHDWEHTLRVYNLCKHIGEIEKADMEILKISALLHDIGRAHQDKSNGKICHAEKGALIAKEILKNYKLSENKINAVIHCIETHRFRNSKIPVSKEAKILFDADKLDAIGAIGIGRSFVFSGEIGAKVHNSEIDINKTKEYSEEDTAYREFVFKLSKIKERMLTEEGKRLAEERHNFMVEFFERLKKEVVGDL